jgi:ATP-dependent Clp protease ATP-binding subunit ClpA
MRFQFTEQVKNAIVESKEIAITLGDKTIHCEHFILALLKLAPNNAAVKYMETVMPKETWISYLEDIAKQKVPLSQQTAQKKWWSFIFPKSLASLSREYEKVLKVGYLEAKILEINEINLSCIFLATLHTSILNDKLDYDSAKIFIKKMI